jgi:hypothetical protein
MDSEKKAPRARGKVEFLASKSEIETLLNSGYSGRFIHEKLSREGKVTMSCAQFYVLIRGITPGERKKSRPRVNSPAQPVTNDNFFHDTQKDVL